MDNLFKYLLLLIFTMMVFSCQNRPSEVLSRKKMENVMYDMYIAEAIIDNDYQKFAESQNKEALIDQVLEKHKISEARWDTSLSWYSDNIDIYLRINDSVKSRLQRNQRSVEKLSLAEASRGYKDEMKSADYIPPHFRIAGLGCSRGFKFKLDSTQLAESFADYDSIYFQFKTLGVFPLETYALKAMLRVEYADTIIYQGTKLEENKAYSYSISRQIEKDTIVSLDGFINLSGKFPPVPIQLYEISLGNNEVKDSTLMMNDSILLMMNDSTLIMNDSIQIMNDSIQLVDDTTRFLKDSTQIMSDSILIMRDSIQLFKEAPRLTLGATGFIKDSIYFIDEAQSKEMLLQEKDSLN